MAQESKHKGREVDEEDESSEDEASEESSPGQSLAIADEKSLATRDGEEPQAESEGSEGDAVDEEEQAAAQLGTDRYVLAGFFAAAMLGAYVIGRAIQSAWISAANKDWFAQNLPRLTAVADDDKATYGIAIGGVIALVTAYRTYQREDVRSWSDDVASELGKVVWPSQKEVTNSTFVVIVASAVATIYLALLDRLWAFVTNIVYGDGS